MRISVDLNTCQTYGQCLFQAPEVFRLHGAETLEWDYAPEDSQRDAVERARAACPVNAITVGMPGDRRDA